MKKPLRAVFLSAFFLAAALSGAQRIRVPPPPRDDAPRYALAVAILAIAEDADSAVFSEALATALERELTAAGFRAARFPGSPDAAESESVLARSVSNEQMFRWTVIARCSTTRGRLLWRIAFYDALDGAMISADAQGAYAGLSALSLVDQSARNAAAQAASLKDRIVPGKHIDYRLRFASADEGASLSFGSSGEGSREAGTVRDGGLTAPFTAFRAGDPVVITISKEGYWPKTIVFYLKETDEILRLPPLMRKTSESFSLAVAASRLFGATAEYRRYLAEDAIFLRAADSLWLQWDFRAGSWPVIHDEARLGLGAFIFRPRDARFRISIGTGLSGLATLILGGNLSDRLYFDAALDPVWFSWEWHLPTWAIFLEQRTSFSLGLSSGLLDRGWIPDNFPMILTLGVAKKW